MSPHAFLVHDLVHDMKDTIRLSYAAVNNYFLRLRLPGAPNAEICKWYGVKLRLLFDDRHPIKEEN